MVCHSLLQWITFCQTSPPWPAHLGCPHRTWLSFSELDKAVVCVIRLTSFLWSWFQCVCPLMPSYNTYHLTWVSFTLDMGYLFTAAPAKHNCCFLPWTRRYLLTAAPPDLEHGVAPLGPPVPTQPPLLGHVYISPISTWYFSRARTISLSVSFPQCLAQDVAYNKKFKNVHWIKFP